MKKWEYTKVNSIEKANELGKQGWEAFGFYYYGGYTIMMKRELISKPELEKI